MAMIVDRQPTSTRLPLQQEVAVAITAAVTVTVAGGWLPGSWEGSMEETGGITGTELVLLKTDVRLHKSNAGARGGK